MLCHVFVCVIIFDVPYMEQCSSEKFSMEDLVVDVAHRTGRTFSAEGVHKPRHIIFRLEKYEDIHRIQKRKREALREVQYYITDDMTKSDLGRKREVKPVIDEARRHNKQWKFRNGHLFINDRIYGHDNSKHEETRHQMVGVQPRVISQFTIRELQRFGGQTTSTQQAAAGQYMTGDQCAYGQEKTMQQSQGQRPIWDRQGQDKQGQHILKIELWNVHGVSGKRNCKFHNCPGHDVKLHPVACSSSGFLEFE